MRGQSDHPCILLIGIITTLVITLFTGIALSQSPEPLVRPVEEEYAVLLPMIMQRGIPPPSSYSYYMESTNPEFLYTMGCNAGDESKQESVVILLFGQPAVEDGIYGTYIFTSDDFVSTIAIAAGAKEWIKGFWACTPVGGPKVTLALGTSNLGSTTTSEHGREWAIMIKDIANFISGIGYKDQISVMGAINIELNYNTPELTKDWIDGYNANASQYILNVGACEGCSYKDRIDLKPDNGWTLEDIYYVSWGDYSSKILPFPEIYAENGVNAKQWQYVAWYNTMTKNKPLMLFMGELTQEQACIDKKHLSDSCLDKENSPNDGWLQLWTQLNSDSITAQNLKYSSDIRWNFISLPTIWQRKE